MISKSTKSARELVNESDLVFSISKKDEEITTLISGEPSKISSMLMATLREADDRKHPEIISILISTLTYYMHDNPEQKQFILDTLSVDLDNLHKELARLNKKYKNKGTVEAQ